MNLLQGMIPSGSSNDQGQKMRGTFSSKDVIPKGYKKGRLSQFTPEQRDLFRQMFPHLEEGSDLSNLAYGDESAFEDIEAPALKQFNELQGGLASRFSGMGGLGARKSSGFQNTMNQSAQDFAGQLQSQRQGLKRQALQDLMDMSGQLLNQRPVEKYLIEKQKKTPMAETVGKWGGFIPGLISSKSGGGSSSDAARGASSIFGF